MLGVLKFIIADSVAGIFASLVEIPIRIKKIYKISKKQLRFFRIFKLTTNVAHNVAPNTKILRYYTM